MPDFDGICSGDIYVFEAEADALLPDLLPFVVQSGRFFDHALRTSAGSLSPRTKWKHLSKFEFRLPPIDDQQELSQLLWAIEDYKRALDRELLMLEELRGALTAGLTELACDGLSVADVVTIAKSGGTPSRKNAAFFKGDIPWLKSGELDDGVSDSGEHISKEAVKQSAAWVVPSGAVLVAMYGDGKTRGNVGFTTAKMTTNQAVLALVPNEELVDPRFLYHWMWSRREHLRSRSGGGSQKNLTKAAIVAEPFPSLPLDKQSARGAQLDQLSKAHTLCVAQRERSRRLQARLANSLLSGTDGLV
jgi:type I restriction enzyme S subunit